MVVDSEFGGEEEEVNNPRWLLSARGARRERPAHRNQHQHPDHRADHRPAPAPGRATIKVIYYNQPT